MGGVVYEAELERWKHTLLLQTRVSDVTVVMWRGRECMFKQSRNSMMANYGVWLLHCKLCMTFFNVFS